jgi:hypothetical protein
LVIRYTQWVSAQRSWSSRGWILSAAIVLALSVACARKQGPPTPAPGAASPSPSSAVGVGSGFLDDYAMLVPGTGEQPTFVYRNPDARWADYDRVLFEPVAIWRSGASSLADVPQEDLERIAWTLQRSVAARLAQRFTLVDQAGPGVLRVRLALTDARQDDAVLDVFTWAVPPQAEPKGGEALGAATQRFVDAAAIEGEVSDATSGTVLAAGVDRRRYRPLTTWGALDAAAQRWAAWFAERLEQVRRGADTTAR